MAYNAVVHAWCGAGAPAEAERVVAAMRAAGLRPTDSTYVELLAALAAAGRVPRAEAYLVRSVPVRSACTRLPARVSGFSGVSGR